MAKYCSIGGQALIEGIMMRGGKTAAIAVRKADGNIETKVDEISGFSASPLLKIPFLRGSLMLISSMMIGIKALTWSAEFYSEPGEAEEPGKFEKWLTEKLGDQADNVLMGISIFIAVVMAFLLFGVGPTLLINLFKGVIKNPVMLSAMEGLTKIIFFMIYIKVISMNKEIQRTFQYHGAEHKTIYCYESGKPLTVENARSFTTLHPRCGTSFILIVFLITIAVFTFVSWNSLLFRIALKVILLPVIAGASYELIRWTGNHDNILAKTMRWPGMMMQKMTTSEPDDSQLEIAIVAMKLVLINEGLMEAETTEHLHEDHQPC